jgi:hypothetical protein
VSRDLKMHLAGSCTEDLSRYNNTITPSGGVKLGRGIITDGTDDKVDCGDIGTIQAISFWVNPQSDTQELILVDTGKDIMLDSGTVTYTGLTASATYINNLATTTYLGNWWQKIVCVFTQADANNFEIGTDGANFGQFRMNDIRAYDSVLDLNWVKLNWEMTRLDRH